MHDYASYIIVKVCACIVLLILLQAFHTSDPHKDTDDGVHNDGPAVSIPSSTTNHYPLMMHDQHINYAVGSIIVKSCSTYAAM